MGLIGLAFLVHTSGVLPGVMLAGTQALFADLAGSVQVLGWAAVLIAALGELRWRNRTGAAAAAVVGLVTVAVGQRAASGGAAELVRLAQQISFWLPLAVTAIVVGTCLARANRQSRPAEQTIAQAVRLVA